MMQYNSIQKEQKGGRKKAKGITELLTVDSVKLREPRKKNVYA